MGQRPNAANQMTLHTEIRLHAIIIGLLLSGFLIYGCKAEAREPLLGWQNFTFGMDQASALKVAYADGVQGASVDCWDQIGRPPYDPCFVTFSQIMEGSEWFVFLLFLPEHGLGRIELRTHEDVASGYIKAKDELTQKFGSGTQRDRFRASACKELGQGWLDGHRSRMLSWIAPAGDSYQISTKAGTIELISKSDSLCWNAPMEVQAWFRQDGRKEKYLQPTLLIVYEQSPLSAFRDRS